MQSFTAEMELIYDKISLEDNLYQVRQIKSIDQLLELNEELGNVVDLSLFNDEDDLFILEYLRLEAINTAFKTTSKGTYEHFIFIFNKINKKGEYYILFSDEQNNLFRALDIEYIELKLRGHNHADPFISTKAFFPFTDSFVARTFLDENTFLDKDKFLDDTLIPASSSVTNYTALELTPTTLKKIDGKNALITKEYFTFMMRAYEYGRGVGEVPHAGVQVNLIADIFGSPNTVDTLLTAAYVGDQYNLYSAGVSDDYFIGSGTAPNPKTVNDVLNNIRLSSDTQMFVQRKITESENHATPLFHIVNGSIPGRNISPDDAITYIGDGVNLTFNGQSTKFPPIPKSLRVEYVSHGVTITARDDGSGNIIGDKTEGTIDYETGELSIFSFVSGGGIPLESPPDAGASIRVSYATTEDIRPTKIEIFNINGDVMFTGTFPQIQFYNYQNHVSFLCAIDRRQH